MVIVTISCDCLEAGNKPCPNKASFTTLAEAQKRLSEQGWKQVSRLYNNTDKNLIWCPVCISRLNRVAPHDFFQTSKEDYFRDLNLQI
jgi:hypothetical protein